MMPEEYHDQFDNPFATDNPWDFPSKVFLVWAYSTQCDRDVAGVWLSLERAKFHAAALAAGKAQPRGTYENPEDMRYAVQPLKQVAVDVDSSPGSGEVKGNLDD